MKQITVKRISIFEELKTMLVHKRKKAVNSRKIKISGSN